MMNWKENSHGITTALCLDGVRKIMKI